MRTDIWAALHCDCPTTGFEKGRSIFVKMHREDCPVDLDERVSEELHRNPPDYDSWETIDLD